MLTVQQTMELTKKLMTNGITNTAAWIRSHPDEECLAYLNDEGEKNTDVGSLIISHNGWLSQDEVHGSCAPEIVKYCEDHNIKVSEFNHPVTISEDVTNCDWMFYSCHSFNQPVVIPKAAKTCYGMFCGCTSFNQPIVIPDGVTQCHSMFYGCNNFDQRVIIPDSVLDCGQFCDNNIRVVAKAPKRFSKFTRNGTDISIYENVEWY